MSNFEKNFISYNQINLNNDRRRPCSRWIISTGNGCLWGWG